LFAGVYKPKADISDDPLMQESSRNVLGTKLHIADSDDAPEEAEIEQPPEYKAEE